LSLGSRVMENGKERCFGILAGFRSLMPGVRSGRWSLLCSDWKLCFLFWNFGYFVVVDQNSVEVSAFGILYENVVQLLEKVI
jgi:hypothetical protein